MASAKPIGIFDSGIGGLTVASAIRKSLPLEPLIYFGDTAHMPYGDKSAEAIKYYSLKIAKFLIDEGAKMIIIACNTASSLAFADLKEFLGNQVPIYNVIDPVVQSLVETGGSENVGVIATKATIDSGIYKRKIQAGDPTLSVSELATPLLAPMIEEGFFNNSISQSIIDEYLSSPLLKDIDSLILACTHYPLIRPEVEAYFKDKILVMDNGRSTVELVVAELERLGLKNTDASFADRFYVSDYTMSFERSTRLFFGDKIHLLRHDIWL